MEEHLAVVGDILGGRPTAVLELRVVQSRQFPCGGGGGGSERGKEGEHRAGVACEAVGGEHEVVQLGKFFQ